MNCFRLACAIAASLSFGLCAKAKAQPPQTPTMRRYVDPPESAVRWLVYAFNRQGDVRGRARRVVGAKPDNPALAEVDEEIKRTRGTFLLSVSSFQTQVDGDEATVTFQVTLRDNLLNQVTQTESLRLRKAETQWATLWNVVPGKPEAVANDKSSGILLRLATLMAHPQEMLALSRAAISRSNIEQLALGMMGLVLDYEDRIEIKADSFKQTLAPYVQSEQLFYAPADKSGQVSYSLNSKLSGLHTNKIAKPTHTVMIYEGKDGQLAFRYDNRAVVAFADGSVKLVTPEEAKSLRWEP